MNVPIVNKIDRRRGIIAASIFLLLMVLVLLFCSFELPDPPLEPEKVAMTMEYELRGEYLEQDNGGGSGSPAQSNEVSDPDPQPDVQENATQEESPITVNSGNGSSDKPNPKPNDTPTKPNEPKPDASLTGSFGGNGSGGQSGSGNGTGFGNDDGPGDGTGPAGGGGTPGERIRITDIHSTPDTPNFQFCKVGLKLTVNASGNVVGVSVLRSNTTTTNEALIQEIIKLAKSEVKYKARPGARNEICYLTVKVEPN